MIAAFVLLLTAVSGLRDNGRNLQRAERVVLLSSRALRLSVDLETSGRGRLLTGEDRFLGPAIAAQEGLPGVVAELRTLVRDLAQLRRSADLEAVELEELGRDGASVAAPRDAARRLQRAWTATAAVLRSRVRAAA